MKFEKHFPGERLRPYIKYFAVSENEIAEKYTVLPTPGMVIGFQYRGRLSLISGNSETKLDSSGITGISDSRKVFQNSAGVGTILVFFTETGFAHFAANPADELFNISTSLGDIFTRQSIDRVEEKLARALTDKQRITVIEQFLLTELHDIEADKLIIDAVKEIYAAKGNLRITDLREKLFISESPFEKRFRKIVGTTPKKFASIVRFNSVLNELDRDKPLIDICYENNFFDAAHFTKDFKRFTGETPENFKSGRK